MPSWARDRLVIGTHGDGSYMFGNPISAHYVGAEQDLPVLTVLFNNQRWQAVRRATVGLSNEGFAAKSKHQPITFLDSISNYQKAVEVADGYGEKGHRSGRGDAGTRARSEGGQRGETPGGHQRHLLGVK